MPYHTVTIAENALRNVRWETSNLLITSRFGEIIVPSASDVITFALSMLWIMITLPRAKVNTYLISLRKTEYFIQRGDLRHIVLVNLCRDYSSIATVKPVEVCFFVVRFFVYYVA